MIHSFLMIGQSNMAGRGFKGEVEPIKNSRIKVLRNGRWQKMYVPVNPDRPFSGVSLAESFADAYAKEHDVDVGLIPCADGGTSLDQWAVGGLLFSNAIYQAELASRTSAIAGILWHQGETDCQDHLFARYEEKCTVILEAFREKLGAQDVPVLVGGLGDYLADRAEDPYLGRNYRSVNRALQKMAEKHGMYGFVSAEGLTSNPDNLHFCAKSLREFGLRYYQEFKKLENPDKVFPEKPEADAAIKSAMELL